MIRVSKQTDYGIVLLSHFADRPRAVRNARELSERTKIPLPMVSKILKMATKEGLLLSHRGARGGYRLARDPARVSVSEIIAALEGPIAMTECLSAPGDCIREGSCRSQTNWEKINNAIKEALDDISLLDMANPLPVQHVLLTTREYASEAAERV